MKKWLNWLLLVVVFSVACGFLANWQFDRREAKLASIALVTENYAKPAVPYTQVVTAGDFSVPSLNWRSVSLTGHFLVEKTLLVRNRPNNGQPGFEQLVPFDTGSSIIFVSRGWLPTGDRQDLPDNIPDISVAEITLIGKIMSAEPQLSRGAPSGQIASINIALAAKKTGIQTTFQKSYLRMFSESPMASVPLTAMPKPSIEEGNNLSYAVQWILFAAMAISALAWRIRKDQQDASGTSPTTLKSKRAKLDAEFEDSLTTEK
jgi:cytochrome oxidase assembly protein ShyY1